MKRFVFSALVILLVSFTPDKPAYLIYNAKSKQTKWSDLVKDAAKADIVLFGELHDNPVGHWLQLELAQTLVKKEGKTVVLGAEMFETDQQLLVDEYLSGLISARNFTDQARLWPNYKTDYAPLLKLAFDEKLKFIATNIPRRYASMVHRGGFEALLSLSPDARQFVAPLPVDYDAELPGYKAMLQMGGEGKGQVNPNLPKAQAIKDATMAHFILKNLPEKGVFVHYHGTYHSNNYEGIYWYLKKRKPNLKILTIASVTQSSIDKLDEKNTGLADYILCVPESMTRTY